MTRIAIRDSTDSYNIGFFDNTNGIKYHSADLEVYAQGSAFLDLKYYSKTQIVDVGMRLAFVFRNKDYWMTVTSVSRESEYEYQVEARSLSLEALREVRSSYKASRNMTFEEYLNVFDPEHSIRLNVNTISNRSRKLEWTGEDTILARILSIATKFDAEIEFETELNDDYSLKEFRLNVHALNELGKDRTGTPFRISNSQLKLIKFKSSIDEFYSAIRGTGKDGLTISGLDKKVYDDEKKLLFYTSGGTIYAPQARDKFISITNKKTSDGYIVREFDNTQHETKEALYAYMLGELKKHCEPQIDYTIDGYIDADVNDKVLLIDDKYTTDDLMLTARVAKQKWSLIDKLQGNNRTELSNYVRVYSEIADELITRMNALIEANKVFDVQILTSNGYSFKNGFGETTLTARVMDGPREVTNEFSVNWYRETDLIGPDASITVQASSINEKVVYRIIAYKDGVERGRSELTLINVNDGLQGPQGPKGEQGEQGATGPAGRDGKGVKAYKITYQAGTSGVTYPTGSWSSTIPTVPKGQYLWSKTTLTYTDNTTSDTYSVAYFPVNGATGATGNGISSYTAEFYLSTSKTTQSGGSWTTTPPTWSNGKYIWTRYKIGYTNGSIAYTTPHCSSEWEAVNDVQKNLDAANQNIAKKVDQEAYDNDKQVIYDDISKKLDDEEFRKFQKTMNDLKSSYESFVGEGGRYEKELQNASKREQAIIQEFGEKVQQFNFINTYIRESEEGIVIGAKGNPMQMLLSKDSLSFMDGGQTVAYFSNQSFYINRGAVVDSLQVGVHKMTRINNEFTVIQYVPN
ncbi:hypothetical protein V4S36_11280 [Enterococcus cecorum]|uniref:hypothetical protein n=1 Tax=Enterococcus cecorum TaxID=44008 RepID=UPI003267D209